MSLIFVISRETMIPLVSTIIFQGSQIATMIAGFVVVMMFVPLKSTTSKFTDRLFTQKAGIQSSYAENLELYKRQLTLAWEDAQITEKEEKLLDVIKSLLEISVEDAQRLEHEVRSVNND